MRVATLGTEGGLGVARTGEHKTAAAEGNPRREGLGNAHEALIPECYGFWSSSETKGDMTWLSVPREAPVGRVKSGREIWYYCSYIYMRYWNTIMPYSRVPWFNPTQ